MTEKMRRKMCYHCDAELSLDATYCPFCGTDLQKNGEKEERKEMDETMFSSKSLDESLAALYTPPYSKRDHEGFGIPAQRPVQEHFEDEQKSFSFSYEDEALASDDFEEEPLVQRKLGGGWPLILLSIGGQLLTLGLLLFFFSTGGKLTLEWNSRYWFLYCIASFPILYFGYRMLNESVNESV